MSPENPTVALVGLNGGTLNFIQAITASDGPEVVPFTTAQIRDLAAVLCNQNLLEVFETGRAATDAVPLIRPEVTQCNGRGTGFGSRRHRRELAEEGAWGSA